MTKAAPLTLEDIWFSYGSHSILAGVSAHVPEGRLFALLGPSGSGKSTLLGIVAGLLAADRGRVILAGEDVTALPPERRGIGFVFQSYALFPSMTARENIAFGARRRGMTRREARTWAAEVAAGLDLTGVLDRRPGELSGGQQQRVALARAIAVRPRLLLLDEPLSNIDPALRTRVRAQLREWLQRWAITTVLVTHDREDAFWLADRLGLLRAGRLVQSGAPAELYRHPVDAGAAELLGPVSRVPLVRHADRLEIVPPGKATHWALLRPEDVEFRAEGHGPGEALTLTAVIEEIVLLGAERRARCRAGNGTMVWTTRAPAIAREGDRGVLVLPTQPCVVPASPKESES